MIAPAVAMRALHHHASPEYPNRRPAEKRKPETVGPNARERLAVEAATPLIVPSIKRDGAEFVRSMALLGYAMVAKVHFQITSPYTPTICNDSGSRARYGVVKWRIGYKIEINLNRFNAPTRLTTIGKTKTVAIME